MSLHLLVITASGEDTYTIRILTGGNSLKNRLKSGMMT